MKKRSEAFKNWNHNPSIQKDSFIPVFKSLFFSDTWLNLTGRQKDLWLFCNFEYYRQRDTPIELNGSILDKKRRPVFKLTYADACKIGYPRPTRNSGRNSLSRDFRALEACGLIKCIYRGGPRREANIYELTSAWINQAK